MVYFIIHDLDVRNQKKSLFYVDFSATAFDKKEYGKQSVVDGNINTDYIPVINSSYMNIGFFNIEMVPLILEGVKNKTIKSVVDIENLTGLNLSKEIKQIASNIYNQTFGNVTPEVKQNIRSILLAEFRDKTKDELLNIIAFDASNSSLAIEEWKRRVL